MSIATALSSYGSRKVLRRLAAELGLQADEPGGLSALLVLTPEAVNAAVFNTITDPEKQVDLTTYLVRLATEGLPPELAQQANVDEKATAAHIIAPPMPPSLESCVECHARTPFVFKLMSCRLCEHCERTCPSKYGVVDVNTACATYGLTDGDLSRLQSTGGKRSGTPQVFLRRDVEACAANMDTKTKQRGAAAAEWRDNSFRPDARGGGKTHKWKEWNSATFQMQKAVAKHQPVDDGASLCVDLSGLVYVGLVDGP